MRKTLGTIAATALTLGLVVGVSPAQASITPLPPQGPPPTCWVDSAATAFMPNLDGLPDCDQAAQATLYQYARGIMAWEGFADILSQNVRILQRQNARRYHKIKRLEREVRQLRG